MLKILDFLVFCKLLVLCVLGWGVGELGENVLSLWGNTENRMMNQLLKNLNERQQEAVQATEGSVRIIAGAGSGKTFNGWKPECSNTGWLRTASSMSASVIALGTLGRFAPNAIADGASVSHPRGSSSAM